MTSLFPSLSSINEKKNIERLCNVKRITPAFLKAPAQLNQEMKSLLNQDLPAKEINRDPILRGGGPVWYRGYALTPVPETCADLAKVLKYLGVRRMVSGHTPQEKKVLETCSGQYVVIDLGISPAYYSNLGGLEMLAPKEPNGPWEVYAVYPTKRERLDVPSPKL